MMSKSNIWEPLCPYAAFKCQQNELDPIWYTNSHSTSKMSLQSNRFSLFHQFSQISHLKRKKLCSKRQCVSISAAWSITRFDRRRNHLRRALHVNLPAGEALARPWTHPPNPRCMGFNSFALLGWILIEGRKKKKFMPRFLLLLSATLFLPSQPFLFPPFLSSSNLSTEPSPSTIDSLSFLVKRKKAKKLKKKQKRLK